MQFELDDVLMDDIIFSMENQDGEYLIDTKKGEVVSVDSDDEEEMDFDDDDRFIDLPEWTSVNGYRLMDKFAAQLKNAVIRQEISAALNVKKGVFRSFKNTLEKYSEVEKMWYAYKEQKLKEEVRAWYNSLREEWGLEKIGSESEDVTPIVEEDFIFREGTSSDKDNIAALHEFCKNENRFYSVNNHNIYKIDESINSFEFSGNIRIVAENSNGGFCGFISAEKEREGFLKIRQLEVKPEYRGMGIGKTLLNKLLQKVTIKNYISIDLPAGMEFFSKILYLEGFSPSMQKFVKGNSYEK